MRLHGLSNAWLIGLLAGCAPPAQTPTDAAEPLALPFAVSDDFAPTGAYGDAESPASVSVSLFCRDRAPASGGSRGDCYAISYAAPAVGYAGVFWQFPPNNWGTEEGRRVAPGATKVTFYARADGAAPVPVTLGVGGIGGGGGMPEPYHDTVAGSLSVMLGNDWQAFSIPISGAYDWVIGGFSWEASTQEPITFYLDHIQWQ